jgi:hypothetical protein
MFLNVWEALETNCDARTHERTDEASTRDAMHLKNLCPPKYSKVKEGGRSRIFLRFGILIFLLLRA